MNYVNWTDVGSQPFPETTLLIMCTRDLAAK